MTQPMEEYAFRHKKRGGVYRVIGKATLQCDEDPHGGHDGGNALSDGEEMYVYRGEDGRLWVRSKAEFEDGRFQVLAEDRRPAPTGDKEKLKAIKRRIALWKELACDGETDPMGQMIKDLETLVSALQELEARVGENRYAAELAQRIVWAYTTNIGQIKDTDAIDIWIGPNFLFTISGADLRRARATIKP